MNIIYNTFFPVYAIVCSVALRTVFRGPDSKKGTAGPPLWLGLILSGSLQQIFHAFVNKLHFCGGLESGHNIAFPVHYELGEVPLDLRVILIILIDL